MSVTPILLLDSSIQHSTGRMVSWALPVLGAAAYLVWSRLGRGLPEAPAAPESYPLHSAGRDAGRGNLLGIQPRLAPADFASVDRLFVKLDGYFAGNRWSSRGCCFTHSPGFLVTALTRRKRRTQVRFRTTAPPSQNRTCRFPASGSPNATAQAGDRTTGA